MTSRWHGREVRDVPAEELTLASAHCAWEYGHEQWSALFEVSAPARPFTSGEAQRWTAEVAVDEHTAYLHVYDRSLAAFLKDQEHSDSVLLDLPSLTKQGRWGAYIRPMDVRALYLPARHWTVTRGSELGAVTGTAAEVLTQWRQRTLRGAALLQTDCINPQIGHSQLQSLLMLAALNAPPRPRL